MTKTTAPLRKSKAAPGKPGGAKPSAGRSPAPRSGARTVAKTVAKKPARSLAGTATKPARKVAAKPAAKPTAKPPSKPPSKPRATPRAKSPPAKRPGKAVAPARTAPLAGAKRSTGPAGRPAAVPLSSTVLHVPKTPVSDTPKKAAASKKSAGKTSRPSAPDTAPAALAAAVSNSRFADRFAPPKPPSRAAGTIDIEVHRPAVKHDPKLVNAWKTKSGRELTEAELLSMPDSEYMNDKQIEFFRHRLQSLKDDLLSNAGETTEHLREDTSIVPDPADRATIEEEHALELRTRDRERKLLKKISQSLARIDNGDYGFCDETGEPIGLGRLIARPTATLSLEAQQRREMKQKMFGE